MWYQYDIRTHKLHDKKRKIIYCQVMKNVLPKGKEPTENKKKVQKVPNRIQELSCNICDKSFAQNFNLKRHISNMH